MKKSIFFLLFVVYTFHAIAQIDCPPEVDKLCTLVTKPFDDIIINQGKFELIPGNMIGNWDCSESNVQMEYYLFDVASDELSDEPVCYQDINVIRLDLEDIVWPEAIIEVVGGPIDEVLSDPRMWAGLSPELDNACHFIYSYSDQILPGQIFERVIRTWIVLDWCTAETVEFVQIIKVNWQSVNGFYIDIQNCSSDTELLEDFDILINDVIVDYQSCTGSAITVLELMNCVAETYSLGATDKVELSLQSVHDPLQGVSTIELIRIQRHILGISPFEDDCSLYAADVNSDNTINGMDLVELRKLILGIYIELPQAGPARYYQAGDILKPLVWAGDEFPIPTLAVGVIHKGNIGN